MGLLIASYERCSWRPRLKRHKKDIKRQPLTHAHMNSSQLFPLEAPAPSAQPHPRRPSSTARAGAVRFAVGEPLERDAEAAVTEKVAFLRREAAMVVHPNGEAKVEQHGFHLSRLKESERCDSPKRKKTYEKGQPVSWDTCFRACFDSFDAHRAAFGPRERDP